MTEDKNQAATGAAEPSEAEMSEAEIDRNLAETFPASDPPSWTLGTDHGRESPTRPAEPPASDETE
jgi:hypothetical protein